MNDENKISKEGTLILNYLDAHKPKVDSVESIWNSPNKDVYLKTVLVIDEIIENNLKGFEEKQSAKTPQFLVDREACNIVAYLGDRGSGKTSGILSILNWLREGNRKELASKVNSGLSERDYNRLLESLTIKTDYNFHILPPIDPSTFEKKERVIEVVIANMFQKFKEEVENNKDISQGSLEYTELVTAFQKVHLALSVLRDGGNNLLKPGDYSESALENLEKLAIGAELNQKFCTLVKEFLMFMNNSKNTSAKNNDYLVITIDDADVHPNEPLLMLEDIRKYLRVPNLILFMGVRFEQLLANIEKHYLKEYEIQLKNRDLFESPKQMSIKYLEKFLPINNRIIMPFSCLENLVSKKGLEYLDKKGAKFKGETIETVVLNYTSNKTGLLFNSFIYRDVHPLVPLSLRELHDYLNELSDYNDPENATELAINIEKFLSYLVNTWAPSYLSSAFVKFINDVNEVDRRFLHHIIVTKLWPAIINRYGLPDNTNLEITDRPHLQDLGPVAINQIYSRKNNYKNITIGDTIGIIKLIRDNFPNKEINGLLFSIGAIVSSRILLDKISGNAPCREYYGVSFSPELIKFFDTDGQLDKYTSFDISNYHELLSEFFGEFEKNSILADDTLNSFLELNKFLIFSGKRPPAVIYDRSINEGLYDKGPSFLNRNSINTHYAHFSLLHYDNFSSNPEQNIERLNDIWDELDVDSEQLINTYTTGRGLLPVFSLEETENILMEAVEDLRKKRFEGEEKLMQRILVFQTTFTTLSSKSLNKINNKVVYSLLAEKTHDKNTLGASDKLFKYINLIAPYVSIGSATPDGDFKRTLTEFLQIFQTYLTSRHRDSTYISTFNRFLERVATLSIDLETKRALSNAIQELLTSFKEQPRGGQKNMSANQRRRYANEMIILINGYLQ